LAVRRDASNVAMSAVPYARRMTRIRDLEWLLRVAELGHVTDAAALLRTSQPTLSRTVARVEEELGAPAFVRTADGVHLTSAGELVVEAARDVTARWARLRTELDALLDPDAGTVRLAFLDSIASSLVPAVLRDFHAHAPAVRVLLSQEPAHEIREDLASGATDLAITSFGIGPELGWHPLQEDRLVVVVPPRHRLAGRKRLRLAELEGEELVTTPVGFGFRTLLDGLLREAGVAPTVSFESQDLATIEGLVAAGLGVAVVPEPFAGVSGTVGIPVVGAAARRTIGLAWWRDRPLSAPAARFRDFVVATRTDTT
jgi:LysR family transcriptional regulator, transcription activator of glutamate synthase operon